MTVMNLSNDRLETMRNWYMDWPDPKDEQWRRAALQVAAVNNLTNQQKKEVLNAIGYISHLNSESVEVNRGRQDTDRQRVEQNVVPFSQRQRAKRKR